MKWIFSPAIALLMHQRNKVKMTLAGVVFCVPLAIALVARPTEWSSAAAIALIVTFVLAWYYIAAMYLTSDESWDAVHRVAKKLSEHDLREQMRSDEVLKYRKRLGTGQFGQLFTALTETHANLRELLMQAQQSADAARAAADQLAAGSVDLSQRTEEQASTLEQTAAAMEELSATVKENALSCKSASQLAGSATAVARNGSEIAQRVVATMDLIDASSKRIGDIIGVIESISFQTNILALNAAVEAARAGEHGRGFAVVAEEVRSLARRSSEAAKEIKALIGDSAANVEQGAKLVHEAGQTITQVTSSVEQVNELIGIIAIASREQASGVEGINRAITQLQGVTQGNAAVVQEVAYSSVTLKEEAGTLSELIGKFKVDGAEARLETAAPQPLRRTARRPLGLLPR